MASLPMKSCLAETNSQLAKSQSTSKIITAQQESRLDNHQASLKSQCPRLSGKLNESYSNFKEGLLIYLKNDRSKHKAREPYQIMKRDGDWIVIRKLLNNKLRGREYKVHITECFSIIPDSHTNPPIQSWEDQDDDYHTIGRSPVTISGPEISIDSSCPINPTTQVNPSESLPHQLPIDAEPIPVQLPAEAPITEDDNPSPPNLITDEPTTSMDDNSPNAVPTSRNERPSRIRKAPSYLEDYVRLTNVLHLDKRRDEEEGATPWAFPSKAVCVTSPSTNQPIEFPIPMAYRAH